MDERERDLLGVMAAEGRDPLIPNDDQKDWRGLRKGGCY
jgi:hypothetical protein